MGVIGDKRRIFCSITFPIICSSVLLALRRHPQQLGSCLDFGPGMQSLTVIYRLCLNNRTDAALVCLGILVSGHFVVVMLEH